MFSSRHHSRPGLACLWNEDGEVLVTVVGAARGDMKPVVICAQQQTAMGVSRGSGCRVVLEGVSGVCCCPQGGTWVETNVLPTRTGRPAVLCFPIDGCPEAPAARGAHVTGESAASEQRNPEQRGRTLPAAPEAHLRELWVPLPLLGHLLIVGGIVCTTHSYFSPPLGF